MAQSEDDLKRVLSAVLGVDPQTVGDALSVDTVPAWDSLRHMNLVLALEEQFNLSFTEAETVEILSYPLIKAVLTEHGISF